MQWKIIIAFCLILQVNGNAGETPRQPFYVIAQMVNSIAEANEFLEEGANALESDVSFYPNGFVKELYHGYPCDCNRDCNQKANLSIYLDHISQITDPSKGSYHERMTLQYFHMKLETVESHHAKYLAGQNLADQVLDHLWGNDYKNQKLIKVVLLIDTMSDVSAIIGFRLRFKERGATELLKNVGYDGSAIGSPKNIRKLFESIGINSNVWQGDGTLNCFSAIYPAIKLFELRRIRKDPKGYINKIYHWTIDDTGRMAKSLRSGVDGMMTNVPGVLIQVLNERFADVYRLATAADDPFTKYITKI